MWPYLCTSELVPVSYSLPNLGLSRFGRLSQLPFLHPTCSGLHLTSMGSAQFAVHALLGTDVELGEPKQNKHNNINDSSIFET